MIARVGLIGGPGDVSGRTGYWPMRFANPSAEDGTVLVPDAASPLPLWLSDPEWQGMNARSNARAKDAGLVLRPLAQTLRDTLEWEVSTGIEKPRRAGLTQREEAELLTGLARATAHGPHGLATGQRWKP